MIMCREDAKCYEEVAKLINSIKKLASEASWGLVEVNVGRLRGLLESLKMEPNNTVEELEKAVKLRNYELVSSLVEKISSYISEGSRLEPVVEGILVATIAMLEDIAHESIEGRPIDWARASSMLDSLKVLLKSGEVYKLIPELNKLIVKLTDSVNKRDSSDASSLAIKCSKMVSDRLKKVRPANS